MNTKIARKHGGNALPHLGLIDDEGAYVKISNPTRAGAEGGSLRRVCCNGLVQIKIDGFIVVLDNRVESSVR